MTRRKKSVVMALLVTTISAGAAYIVRKRQHGERPHVGLYFEDGSMVSLPEQSPQATSLIDLGRDAVRIVRSA